jgi:hypothetical protein
MWELLVANHLDQSLCSTNQKQRAAIGSYLLHSSLAAAWLCWAFYQQPKQTEQSHFPELNRHILTFLHLMFVLSTGGDASIVNNHPIAIWSYQIVFQTLVKYTTSQVYSLVKLESFTPSTSLLLGHLFVCLLVLLMGKRLYALVYDLGMIFFGGGGLNLTQCAIDIWSIICTYDEWACSIKM